MIQTRQILSEIDQAAQEAHDSVRQYILGIRTGKTQSNPLDFWGALEDYLTLLQTRYDLKIRLQAAVELRTELQLDAFVPDIANGTPVRLDWLHDRHTPPHQSGCVWRDGKVIDADGNAIWPNP